MRTCRVILLLLGLCSLGSSAAANTRLGIHVTSDERAIWLQRMTNGPYRISGDVRLNSPGDWTRILNNANSGNFSSERYSGNTINSCASASTPSPPRNWGERVRDAAFVYMMTGTLSYRTAALNELLAQAGTAGTDFTNTTRWCITGNPALNDGSPFWDLAMFITKLAFTYDYLKIGDGLHGQSLGANATTLNNWFLGYGNFTRAKTQVATSGIFPNRTSDDYTTTCCGWSLTGPLQAASNGVRTHFAGYNRYTFHESGWNNRKGGEVRAFGIIGVLLDNATLKTEATRWFKEFLRFNTFPDNSNFSLGLWGVSGSGAAYSYNSAMVGLMITFADAMARTGDTTLYDYSTSLGIGSFTPAGGPKTILGAMTVHAQMMTGDISWWATSNSANVGNAAYKIDTTGDSSNEVISDVWIAPANLYYQDSFINQAYRRLAPGSPEYYASPDGGGYNPWGGEYGVFPGVLFMFGNLEGQVDPYTLGAGDTLAPKPPTGVTATQASATAIDLDCTPPTQNTDNSPLTDLSNYQMLRCQNAGCTPAIHADVTTCDNFQDTGLLASTTYGYQFKARDTSGNLSTASTPIVYASTAAPAPATLVAHYEFTTNATDTTANNHDGTLVGGASVATVDGRSALLLDGINGYMRVTRTALLEPATLTVCAWIRRNGVQQVFGDLINKTWGNDSAPTFESYGLHISPSTNGATFYHGKSGGGESLVSSSNIFPDLTWTHLCAVYDPAGGSPQKRLYVNGNVDTTAATATPMIFDTVGTDNDLYIGWGTVAGRFFKGALDDIRVYNGVLTNEDIAALVIGEPGATPTVSQVAWRWRHIDEPETGRFMRQPGISGAIVLNNQARLRTVISNTGDTAPTQGFTLYCRTPAGSGTWFALNDDCVTTPLCYGFDRRLASGQSTTPQLAQGGLTFASGGKFYEFLGDRTDQISIGADTYIEREHAIRLRSDVVEDTTFGCCERYGDGTPLDSCSEATAQAATPSGFSGY